MCSPSPRTTPTGAGLRLSLCLMAALSLMAQPALARSPYAPTVRGTLTSRDREVAGDPARSSRELNHRITISFPRQEIRFRGRFKFTLDQLNIGQNLRRLRNGDPPVVNRNLADDLSLRLSLAPLGKAPPRWALQIDGKRSRRSLRQMSELAPGSTNFQSNLTLNLRLNLPRLPPLTLTQGFSTSSNQSLTSRSRTEISFGNLDFSLPTPVGVLSYSFQRNDSNRLAGPDLSTSTQRFSLAGEKKVLPWLRPQFLLSRTEELRGQPGVLLGPRDRVTRTDQGRLTARGKLPLGDLSYSLNLNLTRMALPSDNFRDLLTLQGEISSPLPESLLAGGKAKLRYQGKTEDRPGTTSRTRELNLELSGRLADRLPLTLRARRNLRVTPRGRGGEGLTRSLNLNLGLPPLGRFSSALAASYERTTKPTTGAASERRMVSLSATLPLSKLVTLKVGWSRQSSTNQRPDPLAEPLVSRSEGWSASLSLNPSPRLRGLISWRQNDIAASGIETQLTDLTGDLSFKLDDKRTLTLRYSVRRNLGLSPVGVDLTRNRELMVMLSYQL